ncbi:uncharacterized protein LOC144954208, partial [Lampetra fluviatilis]
MGREHELRAGHPLANHRAASGLSERPHPPNVGQRRSGQVEGVRRIEPYSPSDEVATRGHLVTRSQHSVAPTLEPAIACRQLEERAARGAEEEEEELIRRRVHDSLTKVSGERRRVGRPRLRDDDHQEESGDLSSSSEEEEEEVEEGWRSSDGASTSCSSTEFSDWTLSPGHHLEPPRWTTPCRGGQHHQQHRATHRHAAARPARPPLDSPPRGAPPSHGRPHGGRPSGGRPLDSRPSGGRPRGSPPPSVSRPGEGGRLHNGGVGRTRRHRRRRGGRVDNGGGGGGSKRKERRPRGESVVEVVEEWLPPPWVTSTMPSRSPFIPQMGDE